MYAQKKETANLVYKDRLLMLLLDVLYIPSLRVNLLSARYICQARLKA